MKAGYFTAVLLCRGGYQPPVSLPPGGDEGQSKKRTLLEAHVGRGLAPAACLFSGRREKFRRLRAASSFAHGGKGTKTPPGTRPMDYGSTLFRLGP